MIKTYESEVSGVNEASEASGKNEANVTLIAPKALMENTETEIALKRALQNARFLPKKVCITVYITMLRIKGAVWGLRPHETFSSNCDRTPAACYLGVAYEGFGVF